MKENYTVPMLEDAIDEHLSAQLTDANKEQYEQLQYNGSEAYHMVKPITTGNVPIAAAQEPQEFTANLLRIFESHTRIPEVRPFALSISANFPAVDREEYVRNTKANLQTLESFKRDNGHRLPFSFFSQEYEPNTTIGHIRRDLLNSSLLHVWQQYRHERIPEESSLLIADVDTLRTSRGYMWRQQHRIEEGYSYSAANKRYDTSHGTFPELDRALQATNLAHLISPLASYDCHSMYRLSAVVAGEGFAAEDSIMETHRMRRRAESTMGKAFVAPSPIQVPGAIAVSPPRRPFEKFRRGKPNYDFWEEGKFGMQDAYREGISDNHDIPQELSNYFVAEAMSRVVVYARNALVESILNEEGDQKYATIRQIVDQHVLRIAEVADAMLDLRLGELTLTHALDRPALEEI